MTSELKRRGYWARKNKAQLQLLEKKLNASVIERDLQLEREMESTKLLMSLFINLTTTISKLAEEVIIVNKKYDKTCSFEETMTTLINLKKVHDNLVHESQERSKSPVHEKPDHPFHRPKRKKTPCTGRKVRKKL